MARSQCNCFAGLELKRCHMPRTRDRKVGMKEIQQWLIRKSYESETFPLSSVHQETNQTNFLLENLRNFLLENLLNFLLENLRSFLLENLRLSVQSRILWVETHCWDRLKTAKTNCERISIIGSCLLTGDTLTLTKLLFSNERLPKGRPDKKCRR